MSVIGVLLIMENGLAYYVLLEFLVDFKKNREKENSANFYSIPGILTRANPTVLQENISIISTREPIISLIKLNPLSSFI